MNENDIITDGNAQFKVRKLSKVQSVNNTFADDNGNIDITSVVSGLSANYANIANKANDINKSGDDLGVLLWNWLHRYGSNYVPSDTSNYGWNRLGICIIYYTIANKIKNQPSQYGQLINIPADLGDESRQIWLTQPNGGVYHRGGNGGTSVNDSKFIQI